MRIRRRGRRLPRHCLDSPRQGCHEQGALKEILAHCCGPGVRLWRNNVGALSDRNGHLVRYGLAPGSSDLIGLRQVTVSEEMVGRQMAVFVAIEVKSARGRLTTEQRRYLQVVERLGGITGVARSVGEAEALLSNDPTATARAELRPHAHHNQATR